MPFRGTFVSLGRLWLIEPYLTRMQSKDIFQKKKTPVL